MLAAPGHGKGCQDGFGGSLCTASEGRLPALHGNTASGSVGVFLIEAFLGHRSAWLQINPWCSQKIDSGCVQWDGEGFPELGCVLIPSHRPPPSITVVCGPHNPVIFWLFVAYDINLGFVVLAWGNLSSHRLHSQSIAARPFGVDGGHRVAQKISTTSPLSPLTWGVGSSTAEA